MSFFMGVVLNFVSVSNYRLFCLIILNAIVLLYIHANFSILKIRFVYTLIFFIEKKTYWNDNFIDICNLIQYIFLLTVLNILELNIVK